LLAFSCRMLPFLKGGTGKGKGGGKGKKRRRGTEGDVGVAPSWRGGELLREMGKMEGKNGSRTNFRELRILGENDTRKGKGETIFPL